MEIFKQGVYESHINETTGTVTIKNGTQKVTFMTGEGASAKKAIKFSSTLFNVSVLPEAIRFTPFVVRFQEDGSAKFAKTGFGEVSFDKTSYEDLIALIDTSVNRIADYIRIRGGARAGISSVRMPDPLI